MTQLSKYWASAPANLANRMENRPETLTNSRVDIAGKINIREVWNTGSAALPLTITRNGEAMVVPQDVASYTATQELLALLKLLAIEFTRRGPLWF